MAQTCVDGLVSSDIELKISAKGNPYVRFELVEQIGRKENGRTQYFHICAFAEDAIRIVNAGTAKGSHVLVIGSLEEERYGMSDGHSQGARMKIMLTDWRLLPIGASGKIKFSEQAQSVVVEPCKVTAIDGEKEPLPR